MLSREERIRIFGLEIATIVDELHNFEELYPEENVLNIISICRDNEIPTIEELYNQWTFTLYRLGGSSKEAKIQYDILKILIKISYPSFAKKK